VDILLRFKKVDDRKRALVSRLLQYSLVRQLLDIPFDEIRINRTLEGKPFLGERGQLSDYPNLNFNTSHCGDYVGIASEPLCIVGLDIVSTTIPKHLTAIEFVRNFEAYFTSLEWRNILYASTPDQIMLEFCRYWCLKEAYVKAIGAGLGYGLDRIEFNHHNWMEISVTIDGVESKEWVFWLFQIDDKHCASIARGPPDRAIGSYRNTLQKTHIGQKYLLSGDLPASGFTFRAVNQLIPDSKR